MKSVRFALIFVLCSLLSACASGSAGAPSATTVPPHPAVLDELPRGENKLPLINVYLTDASTVAEMDIETYVCGVLAGEMPSDWPLEALKAQAILVRTFVLKFVSAKSSRYEGADISTDITEAQAYDTEAINETIRQAVNETRGQVLLTSSGELPYAWFHAHSGGTTALAREALGWNKPEPAYTQVMDSLDSKDAPAEAIAWEASFAAADFLRACRAAGVPCETARSVTIGEKGPSGRAVTLLVDGVSVPAPELRIALGSTVMRSTLLDEVRVTDGNVFIAGRGYGHGVGMSQWGAYALAQDGMSGQDIAAYYFKGLSVATLW